MVCRNGFLVLHTCADEKKKFLVGVVFGQLKARLHLLKTLFFKKERLENVCT